MFLDIKKNFLARFSLMLYHENLRQLRSALASGSNPREQSMQTLKARKHWLLLVCLFHSVFVISSSVLYAAFLSWFRAHERWYPRQNVHA